MASHRSEEQGDQKAEETTRQRVKRDVAIRGKYEKNEHDDASNEVKDWRNVFIDGSARQQMIEGYYRKLWYLLQ